MKTLPVKFTCKNLIRLHVILFFVFISFNGISQNYVPNWSFENLTACPTWWNQIERITGWHKAKENIGTDTNKAADYCNACGVPNFDVPSNIWGNQEASTGNAYVAIATMASTLFTNYRENIYTKLIAPLVPGESYVISMKVSKANNSRYSTDNIGLKFSTTTSFPVNNISHLHSTSVITDTLGWIDISSVYTADSAYKYLAVGNFFDDAHTTVLESCHSCKYPHYIYYVDDICVKLLDDVPVKLKETENCFIEYIPAGIDETNTVHISFYPNPFNDYTNLITGKTLKNGCLTIFDQSGKTVRVIENIKNETRIKRGDFKSGIYHFSLKEKNKIIGKGNLIITEE